MADKPASKPVGNADAAGRLTTMLLVLAAIAFLLNRFGSRVQEASEGGTSAIAAIKAFLFGFESFNEWVYAVRVPLIIISFTFSGLALWGTLYAKKKTTKLRSGLLESMALFEKKMTDEALSDKNVRWEHVLTLANSESPGDWRTAIIEADIMLDELLTGMSYHGDTLGDKLKSVEASDFRTLDLAWDGHKIRNRIAHHGSDFILTERETKRVIDLYRQVFQEFDYI